MKRKRRLPPNVSSFLDRHGKERFRYRKGAVSVYLRDHPGTLKNPSDEVKELSASPGQRIERHPPGTINDLLARFYRSSAWEGAGADTKRVRRGILEAFRERHGTKRVAAITFEHVEAILVAKSRKAIDPKTGRTVGGKEAARSLRKQLVRVFDLAVKLGMVEQNPVRMAEAVKVEKTGGHHSWTEDEIAKYQEKHGLGTKARLALEIILWTGQRRGDARLFGRKHLRGGKVNYTQGKGGKDLWLPAAPQLMAAISAMAVTGTETFLVTDYGKPFSAAGLGNKMREWCDEAGLPQCSAHGLRKAIARRAAELGAGNQGLKAIGGWSNDSMVAIYTAAADQEALAEGALRPVIEADLANHAARDLANQQASE